MYFHKSAQTTPLGTTSTRDPTMPSTTPAVVIAAAPLSYKRWKTAPTMGNQDWPSPGALGLKFRKAMACMRRFASRVFFLGDRRRGAGEKY
jgi:hypothetical protein